MLVLSLSYWESDVYTDVRITNISQSLPHKMAENSRREEITYVFVRKFAFRGCGTVVCNCIFHKYTLHSVITKSGVSTFRSSSVGVSALGRTNLHFVDPGVKVNGQYYRDILLTRDLLPDIKQYSDYFTFQQDELPFIEKELQQLVQRQVTAATWKRSGDDASPPRRYSSCVHTTTTDADDGGCPCRVR